jgi:hypothetical protein
MTRPVIRFDPEQIRCRWAQIRIRLREQDGGSHFDLDKERGGTVMRRRLTEPEAVSTARAAASRRFANY